MPRFFDFENRIKQYFWGAIVLCIYFSKPIDKEADVPYPTELASKGLDLSIERFSGGIGAPPLKVVQDGLIMVLYGPGDGIERLEPRFFA